MAKWGKTYFSQLKKLSDKLEKMEAQSEQMAIEALKEVAQRMLREVIANTNVVTGHLRGRWDVTSVTKKGNYYEIEVFNPVEYALYYEEGHRQEAGRYVPAIGKTLKEPWVKGQFTMQIAAERIDGVAQGVVDKIVYKHFKDVFQ